MGEWDTEWSLRHMCRLIRRVTIRQAINSMSRRKADMHQLNDQLENYLYRTFRMSRLTFGANF